MISLTSRCAPCLAAKRVLPTNRPFGPSTPFSTSLTAIIPAKVGAEVTSGTHRSDAGSESSSSTRGPTWELDNDLVFRPPSADTEPSRPGARTRLRVGVEEPVDDVVDRRGTNFVGFNNDDVLLLADDSSGIVNVLDRVGVDKGARWVVRLWSGEAVIGLLIEDL